MPAPRSLSPCLVLVVGLAVGACGSTATPVVQSAPSASVNTGPSSPQSPPSVAPSSLSPTASAPPPLQGQIVWEDAGDNFQFTQVWIQNADGSNARKIVSDGYTDGAVSLSADGRSVVFYRGKPEKSDIVIAKVDGSDLHELHVGVKGFVPGAGGCDAGPEGDAWSPDSTRIVYTLVCFDKDLNATGSGLWTVKVDGTDAREVTHQGFVKSIGTDKWEPHLEDHRAAWSPDGQQLVFERIDTSVSPERAAIFTIGVDGKHLHQVTPWALDGNDPDWSPDGTLIAFNASAEPSPTQNIYTIHPDGSGLTKLTTYDEDGQATFHPSWSPDGTQILFSHSPSTGGWGDLFVMDRDGSHQRVIAKTALHENHAQWGPSPAP
jgi:Tol biopolymer transport system component